jgi:hypothetical protein
MALVLIVQEGELRVRGVAVERKHGGVRVSVRYKRHGRNQHGSSAEHLAHGAPCADVAETCCPNSSANVNLNSNKSTQTARSRPRLKER